jgi:hypothetical protein
MNQPELCHWLLIDQDQKTPRSVFAPLGTSYEGYRRIGEPLFISQLRHPLIYAVADDFCPQPAQELLKLDFVLARDNSDSSSAFLNMAPLKIATLVSEFAGEIKALVEGLDAALVALQLPTVESAHFTLQVALPKGNFPADRALQLMHAALEMMAYARGLRCVESTHN